MDSIVTWGLRLLAAVDETIWYIWHAARLRPQFLTVGKEEEEEERVEASTLDVLDVD